MKKLFSYIIVVLSLAACEVQFSSPGPVYSYAAPVCEDTLYSYEPEWCEYYDDGTVCCSWWSFDHYEEWCQWESDVCWDYNGSF